MNHIISIEYGSNRNQLSKPKKHSHAFIHTDTIWMKKMIDGKKIGHHHTNNTILYGFFLQNDDHDECFDGYFLWEFGTQQKWNIEKKEFDEIFYLWFFFIANVCF